MGEDVKEMMQQFKDDLRSVLIASGRKGVRLRYIAKEFEELHYEPIPFKELGYTGVISLLKDCRDACRFGPDPENPGEKLCHMVADAKTAHMKALQDKTPIQKKRKKNSRYVRTTYPSYRPTSKAYPSRSNSNLGVTQRLMPRSFNGIGRPSAPPAASRPWPPVPRSAAPRPSTALGAYRPSNVIKPSVANVPSQKPGAKKISKVGPEIYGGYVASILKPKKFNTYKADVEDAYEKKFKESLPPDWVDQLKGTVITIAKDYGKGILSVKLTEGAAQTKSSSIESSSVKSEQPKVIEPADPVSSKEKINPKSGSLGDEGIDMSSPIKSPIAKPNLVSQPEMVSKLAATSRMAAPSMASKRIAATPTSSSQANRMGKATHENNGDVTDNPASVSQLVNRMENLKLNRSEVLTSEGSDQGSSSDWSSCEDEVEELLRTSLIDKELSEVSDDGVEEKPVTSTPQTSSPTPEITPRVVTLEKSAHMMTSLKVTLPVNSSQQPKEEPVKRQAQTTTVHRHNLTPAYNPRRRRPGVPLTAAAVPQATAAVATGTTCSRPSTVEPTAQSAEPSVTSLPSNNLPRRQPNLVKAPRPSPASLCSTPAAARLRQSNRPPPTSSDSTPAAVRPKRSSPFLDRFYRAPGSPGFSPLNKTGQPLPMTLSRLQQRAGGGDGLSTEGKSLLDMFDGMSMSTPAPSSNSSRGRRRDASAAEKSKPVAAVVSSERGIAQEIFKSDDSDFESAESDPENLANRLEGSCICGRDLCLVYCKSCNSVTPNSRVKMVCKLHPRKFLTCDRLCCPTCKATDIIEVTSRADSVY